MQNVETLSCPWARHRDGASVRRFSELQGSWNYNAAVLFLNPFNFNLFAYICEKPLLKDSILHIGEMYYLLLLADMKKRFLKIKEKSKDVEKREERWMDRRGIKNNFKWFSFYPQTEAGFNTFYWKSAFQQTDQLKILYLTF